MMAGIKSFREKIKAILIATILLFILPTLSGQDEVLERVEVINREVVVRVFDGGEPVPGLTRKDFTLMENGTPVTITSCRMESRALSPDQKTLNSRGTEEKQQRGRLFLFLLWLNEDSKSWPKAWEYFQRKIYRSGDIVLLANKSEAIRVDSIEKELEKIKNFFSRTSAFQNQTLINKIRVLERLEDCAKNFHEDLVLISKSKVLIKTPEIVFLNAFKNCYKGILNEYRLRRLRAQPKALHRLAEGLRSVDGEKWVLLFLQNERLPLVHKNNRLFMDTPMKQTTAAELGRFIDMCDKDIRMSTDMVVHVHDLRSLFIGTGATFHLFLSDAKGEMLDSDFLRWFPVFSSWESAFRGIAKDTGGDVQNTTKLKQALERAASRTDIYYVLTYKPKAPGLGKPKIKIKVSSPGLKVVYARKLRPKEIRPLKLSEPVWKEGILQFSISDYLRETGEGGTIAGDVHVKVNSETFEGKSLEFENVLHPAEESAAVEMKVNFPEPGDYILTVTVSDRLSGNSASNYTRASIAPPESDVQEPMDPKLKAVLGKSAVYCRALQKAAFRFTCTEAVEEKVLKRNPVSKRVDPETNKWNYDYQVVAEQGEVTEQRTLVRRGHRKVNLPEAKLETRFKAHYSVFLPVTLLGEQNRPDYAYSLLETVRLKKRTCAVIQVTPCKFSKGPIARGKVWVDVEKGSVLKIEMDPRGVAGSAALEASASKMSARLDLKAVHWYLEERKGLRFPSSAEFTESYTFDKQIIKRKIRLPNSGGEADGTTYTTTHLPTIESRHRQVEFYRMSQTYKKYRYFEVDTRVEEELPQ